MTSNWNLLIFSALLLVLPDFYVSKTIPSQNPVERPLRIGSFNVQKLGNSKLGNEKVMDIVKNVLIRYDLALVQEIVTTDETLMETVVKEMNNMVLAEDRYSMVISERLGRDRAKEQYAFIYREKRLSFLAGKAYPDPDDDFMRPPYIVHFSTPTLRDMESMVAIGIHTQPRNAANETSALASVYDYASKLYKQKNAIIMGDMNAGCQNVRISDWDSIELWTRKEFTWLITHDVDTTLSSNCCPYDRFVIAGSGMDHAVIWPSIMVYNFQDVYELTIEKALEVSDHWPIEVELRGKVSDVVAKHLTSTVCVTIDDTRKTSLPTETTKRKTILGFQIERNDISTTFTKTSDSIENLLKDFQKFAKKYSELVSNEILEAVAYKVEHGVLDDSSAHADLDGYGYSVVVDYDMATALTTVHFCSSKPVN